MAEVVSMRKAYGDALVALGHERDDVVVLSADVANSDHSFMFDEVFPNRFFNVGIAEPALVDISVGFAITGRVPFANTFAAFFATRAVEMVRTHACYGGANIKLMGAYAGLSDSFDGPTHHCITDLAIMRSLPNMTIVVPSDPNSLSKFLPQIAAWDGPVYCRLNRNAQPVLFDESYKPEIGKAVTVREGGDATIIACGVMVDRALQAAEQLKDQGINARVIEMHTVKPLDVEAVVKAAEETGAVVTAEEHNVLGGLGGAVTEVLSERAPVPVRRVGVADRFAETGPYEMLLDNYGLAVEDVKNAVVEATKSKR